jgi:hypothetical protein
MRVNANFTYFKYTHDLVPASVHTLISFRFQPPVNIMDWKPYRYLIIGIPKLVIVPLVGVAHSVEILDS